MTERVERPEPDRVGLSGQEARPPEGRPRRERGRQRRAAGASVVGSELEVAAMRVGVAGHRPVLLDVGGVGHPAGRGRAGDVGDGRDVVPVDAVADAQEQPGEQDAQVRGGRGDGGGRADEIDHVASPRGGCRG